MIIAFMNYNKLFLYPTSHIQFTALTRELPLNVHLLTLQSLGGGSYLLRLEHQFEIDEAPWNDAVNVSLAVSLTEFDGYSSL